MSSRGQGRLGMALSPPNSLQFTNNYPLRLGAALLATNHKQWWCQSEETCCKMANTAKSFSFSFLFFSFGYFTEAWERMPHRV